MHYLLLIYFNNKPLHVSSRFAAHHQEDRRCINSNWYSHAFGWLAASSWLYNLNSVVSYPVNQPTPYKTCRKSKFTGFSLGNITNTQLYTSLVFSEVIPNTTNIPNH